MLSHESEAGQPNLDPYEQALAEARELFDADKEEYNESLLRLRAYEMSQLDPGPDVPAGYREYERVSGVSIYPPGTQYYALHALRARGFDIRFIGPIREEAYPSQSLHDSVTTAIRDDEYDRVRKILFKAEQGQTPQEELRYSFGTWSPISDPASVRRENMWYTLLDNTLRTPVLLKRGRIFSKDFDADLHPDLADAWEGFMASGILQRLYMAGHLNREIIYRNRPETNRVQPVDLLLYAHLRAQGVRACGPEELLGMSTRMIREILQEHPEWDIAPPKPSSYADHDY